MYCACVGRWTWLRVIGIYTDTFAHATYHSRRAEVAHSSDCIASTKQQVDKVLWRKLHRIVSSPSALRWSGSLNVPWVPRVSSQNRTFICLPVFAQSRRITDRQTYHATGSSFCCNRPHYERCVFHNRVDGELCLPVPQRRSVQAPPSPIVVNHSMVLQQIKLARFLARRDNLLTVFFASSHALALVDCKRTSERTRLRYFGRAENASTITNIIRS